jgi:hypothetical protein
MTVNKFFLPIAVLAGLFAAYALASATGFWNVSGKTMIDVTSLESSEDVRGWMTLQQIADGYRIDPGMLYTILELPIDIPPSTALKDIEGLLPDFEVTIVKERLAVYLGEAPALDIQGQIESTPIPTATPQPEATSPAVTHIPSADGSGSDPTVVLAGQVLAGSEIKGRHTLHEIAEQCQVPLDKLLAALDLPGDTAPEIAVKDLVEAGQVSEIQAVHDAVTALQSQK